VQRRQLLQLIATSALPCAAWAQTDFPRAGTTIRYIVPFPPGGLTDVMARLVGQQLADRLKVPVVVDNRPGGNAQIGADAVAKSAPDGTSLLAITLTHAANVTLFPNAPYSFTKDLRAVALLAGSSMLVVVPATSPIKTFQDLVAASKSRKLNAGSSGNGTPPHLTLALFNQINKSDIQHVPYKGGAPSMTDLIGGQIDVVFSNFPESISHVKSGRLRALAIASGQRHPMLPEVPTTLEAGMGQLQVENWTGIMAPAKTPDAIVEKIGREAVKILFTPEIEERARTQGFRIDPRGPDKFAEFLKSEVERWGRVIKTAGIKAD